MSKRQEKQLDILRDNAGRLLDDPALRAFIEFNRNEIINKLLTANMDGSEASNRYIIELVRTLRANERPMEWLEQLGRTGKFRDNRLDNADEISFNQNKQKGI